MTTGDGITDPAQIDWMREAHYWESQYRRTFDREVEQRLKVDRLKKACQDVLAIAEDRADGNWDDVMLLLRAVLSS